MNNKKPRFTRQRSHDKLRVKKRWRKPRGIDSKQKHGFKSKGAKPRIGYGSPTAPQPTMVRNLADLEAATGKIVIAARIGKKKKTIMLEKAAKKNLEVVNP